jgi:hypothetical protein
MKNVKQFEGGVDNDLLHRHELLRRGVVLAIAASHGFSAIGAAAAQPGGEKNRGWMRRARLKRSRSTGLEAATKSY